MIIKLQRWFWLFILLFSPALLLEAYFAGNWYSILHSYSLAMFFGILSFGWLANTLIIAARFHFLDRLFGHDKIMKIHGYLASSAIICALIHAILKQLYFEEGNFQMALGSIALILFFIVAFLTTMFMVTNFLHLIPIIKKIRTSLIKFRFLDYSRLKLFHNITALAMLLIIFHVLMAAPTSENNYRLAMVGSWGAISILVYAYHKLVRYFWRKSQALNLSEVKSISPDVLYLIARPNKYLPKHRAGQFGYFRLLSPACGIEEHPFTIASDPESKTLDIMIKILGDYTLKLKNLPAETKMLFDGPYGLFTPKLNAHQYLFIAGGIGITPFLAIIREWSNSKISKPVTLIWSVRRNEDLVDDGLFERVAEEHKYFNYVKVLTRDENVPSRHIDLELLTEVFPENDLNDIQAYLCGPESLQKDVSRLLKKLGLRRKQIHYESFGY